LADLKISLHVKNETIYALISLDNSKHRNQIALNHFLIYLEILLRINIDSKIKEIDLMTH